MDYTTGSPQNGLLLFAALHKRFDQYLFSTNCDVSIRRLNSQISDILIVTTYDDYNIIIFLPNSWNINGRMLDPVCRDRSSPNHVPDKLLRLHFHKSILENMHRAVEPTFEADFPPGSDQIKTMSHESYGKESLELELALRLKHATQEGQERITK